MPFVSSLFLGCYLPLLWLLTSLTHRYSVRFWILLVFSALFYWWAEPLYFMPLVLCILVTFASGVALTKHPRSKWWLLLGVGVSLGQLFWIKYGQFVFSQLLAVGIFIPQSWIFPQHLPLGLSFFTFHAVSYLIDVYRGEVAATKSLPFLAQYFLFFPHQIAGPIVRFKTFAPPAQTMSPTAEDVSYGVERFVLGLAKKLLLADTFATTANHIFGAQVGDLSTPLAWAGTLSYSLQIYFDFSGYSDMAIGLAMLFGIRFHENFNYPYRSTSITDFWRRWHISLSTWFRDYVYIPLGGNRTGSTRTYFNLVIVFFLCGLWHGANWTFIVWGLWHGLFLVVERAFPSIIKKLGRFYWLVTYAIVAVGWVFFRADNLTNALVIIERLFVYRAKSGASDFIAAISLNGRWAFLVLLGLIFSGGEIYRAFQKLRWLKTISLLALLVLCLSKVANETFSPFIYFRF